MDAAPLDDSDADAFLAGTHTALAALMGGRPTGHRDATWRVWAPRARRVEVICDANNWDGRAHRLRPGPAGVWHGRSDDIPTGVRYKFRITTATGERVDKADPFALEAECPPATASKLTGAHGHLWGDGAWMDSRSRVNCSGAHRSIYEVHLGSWRQRSGYASIAEPLADHLERCGFTHVEFLPLTEHPFGGSWGYQTTGYFAPTARYGPPADLAALVDHLHQRGFGVIGDWAPAHFPDDPHGLASFDGTACFEHPDPRLGRQPDWDSLVFDFGSGPVRSFLASSAHHWLEAFHLDGLRVDAVSSMLYRDFSRAPNAWIPNDDGGVERWEAVDLLAGLTGAIRGSQPGTITIAEESSAWRGVTATESRTALGFDLKWDLGWMHDVLGFLSRPPAERSAHHRALTFRSVYAHSERFVLPLSHDEVVHAKGSLLDRMVQPPNDPTRDLRLLFGLQWTSPGVPLLFMGGELGQRGDWDHDGEIPWELADDPAHRSVVEWIAHLNQVTGTEPALHAADDDPDGFRWLTAGGERGGLDVIERRAPGARVVLVVVNCGPNSTEEYIPIPRSGAGSIHGGLAHDHQRSSDRGVQSHLEDAAPAEGDTAAIDWEVLADSSRFALEPAAGDDARVRSAQGGLWLNVPASSIAIVAPVVRTSAG